MRMFANVIQDRCVACGSCAKVCPLGAISVWRGVTAVVDMGRCVGCSKFPWKIGERLYEEKSMV